MASVRPQFVLVGYNSYMLYLFYGEDGDKSRAKVQKLTESLLKKKPDAELFRLEDDTLTAAALEQCTESQGLFAKKFIVVLDHTFSNSDSKDEVLGSIQAIAESPNIFILLEGKIDKRTLTKLEKHAEKSQVADETKKKGAKRDAFNVFTLTDALGRRDRNKLWALYQTALGEGKVPEELHGLLFWQVKSMLLAASHRTAAAAGLKPFVYTKAKRFTENYSGKELQALSNGMVRTYHEARRGEYDLATGLERLILAL